MQSQIASYEFVEERMRLPSPVLRRCSSYGYNTFAVLATGNLLTLLSQIPKNNMGKQGYL